jgi:hypothetical protein
MNRLTNLSFKDVQEVLAMARNENTMPGLFHWLKELNREDEEIIDILVKPIPANSKIFDASLIFSDEATAQRQFSKKELAGRNEELFIVVGTIQSIRFYCVACHKLLTIKRMDDQSIQSGVFCHEGCDESYYINWDDGILKRVKNKEQQNQ